MEDAIGIGSTDSLKGVVMNFPASPDSLREIDKNFLGSNDSLYELFNQKQLADQSVNVVQFQGM